MTIDPFLFRWIHNRFVSGDSPALVLSRLLLLLCECVRAQYRHRNHNLSPDPNQVTTTDGPSLERVSEGEIADESVEVGVMSVWWGDTDSGTPTGVSLVLFETDLGRA